MRLITLWRLSIHWLTMRVVVATLATQWLRPWRLAAQSKDGTSHSSRALSESKRSNSWRRTAIPSQFHSYDILNATFRFLRL